MQTVKLSNGLEMPQLGFGVFQIEPDKTKDVVLEAIKVGYRSFDTATAYQNEAQLGQAIQASGIDRAEFFITSKLWVSDANYERAKAGIQASLERLGTDYIDLYLLHQPFGDVYGAWRALTEAYEAGQLKAIGVANFEPDHLKNLELMSKVKPMVNQIEINPFYTEECEVKFNQAEGVQVMSWAPFAEGHNGIFTNETLQAIADAHHKTVGQVILRWELQQGIILIPKSVHQERMQENFAIFDFELSDEEMKQVASLNTGKSQFFSHWDPVAIEQIFGSSLAQLKE
ncbi:Oxidoreductase [Limosilactobacillus gastricus PS3]|uniref:Oxidoreductase n=1 Tax=Limosilactobacillus gastricus PS3 TaxID=1144300 RepID=H4GJB6_9LACO|nr:aldo/keto reductase [Limosilactobacillus gastricus]EHS87006.1 Oxidoreductase [Limosilactobacillus gastricus PS3]